MDLAHFWSHRSRGALPWEHFKGPSPAPTDAPEAAKAGHRVDQYVPYLDHTDSEGQSEGGISVPQKEDFLVVRTQIEGQENWIVTTTH